VFAAEPIVATTSHWQGVIVKSGVFMAVGSILAAAQLIAAESEQEGAEPQVIVTGTRRAARTAADSSVPIDVVSNDDLQNTASTDLNNKLQAVVPSYSVRRLPLS
jgi:iron complex outermembrane recepter protein